MSQVFVHKGDLPQRMERDIIKQSWDVAVDVETSWDLNFRTSRLGTVSIGIHSLNEVHIVQIKPDVQPHLVHYLLEDERRAKFWHYGLFDLRVLLQRYPNLRVVGEQYDTQLLAKMLAEPRTNLKTLLEKYCDLSKLPSEAESDWFAEDYTPEQIEYCRRDVAYLEPLFDALYEQLPTADYWRYDQYANALVARAMSEVFEDTPDIWGQR
jgi:ribonuclease D